MAANERSTLTEADGYQLAADMLRDLHEEWLSDEEFQQTEEEGAWRLLRGDTVRRYMETVSNSGSQALERGFYAVLTDFIGSCVDGAVPDAEFYEKVVRHG